MDDADRCLKCNRTLEIGDFPFCPHSKGVTRVIPDDYGRDIVCETMGHEPVTYRTRSERRRLMKQHGVDEFVRHVGKPGSDKSDKTTRWI